MGRSHTLVIGGTRGIGWALTQTLARRGHRVSVIGRRPPPKRLRSLDVRYWPVDVLNAKSLESALTQIIKRSGKLNHLVFFQRYRGKEDHWALELETSLSATKNIIDRLDGQFAASGEKSIVIVGSINDRLIAENLSLGYHVAKAGLRQMVRYYAVTLGGKGIRVNGVSPGTVLKEESKGFYLADRRMLGLMKEMTPLGRMGTAEEVAEAIAFLLGPQASFINGQSLVVDGGLSIQWQESLVRKTARGTS